MKTKKNRIVLSGISVLLVLSLLVGGTMAWFTDTEKVDANFSAGVLDIIAEPGIEGKATLEFENLRPLTETQFDDELVQADLSNKNQEGFGEVPVYFQPVKITNNGTLPVYIQITAESIFGKDGFKCPEGGEKAITLTNNDKTVDWDSKKTSPCTNGLEGKLKIFVYAKNSTDTWERVPGINLNKASLETGEEATFTPSKDNFIAANKDVTYVIGGYLPDDADNNYQGKHYHGNVVVNAYQTDDDAGINPPDPETVKNTINIQFKEKEEIISKDTYTFTAQTSDTEYVLRPDDLADITPAGYEITGLEEVRTRAAAGLAMHIPLENGKVVNESYKTITAIVERIGEATYTYTIQNKINGTETVLSETTGSAPAGELVYTPSNMEKDGKTYAPVQSTYTYQVSDAPEKNVFEAFYEEVKNPVDVAIKIQYQDSSSKVIVKSATVYSQMVDGESMTLRTDSDDVKKNIPTSKNYVFDGEPQEQVVTYPGDFTGKTVEGDPIATVTFLVKEEKAVEGVEVTVSRFTIKGTATDIANPGPVIISQELADQVKAANGANVLEPLNSNRVTLPDLTGTGYEYVDLDKQKIVLKWENNAVHAISSIAVQAATASYTNLARMAAPARALMTASLNVANTAKAATTEQYYIYSQEDLAAIDDHLNANVYLSIENISLTGNWVPPGWTTGSADKPFTGNFYGGGNTISNLKVAGGSADAGAGLFAYNKGTIQDLKLTNVNVVAGAVVGSISAQNAGTIRDCHVDGFVKAITHAPTTLGDASFVGGITGANSGVVDRCSADVKVVGLSAVGGLVGYNTNGGSVSECWTKGSVNEGYSSNISVNMIQIGGLVGANTSGATINNCWSAPTKIVGYQNVGGFVGYNKATVKNSYVTDASITYYTTPVHECVGSIYTPTSVVTNTYYVSEEPTYMAAKGVAITDSALKAATSLTGFDASVWDFPEGAYPVLKNNR